MTVSAITRNAPARHAVIFATVCAAVMAALLAVLYFWITRVFEEHLDQVILEQVAILKDDLRQDGRASMLGLVQRHAERNDQSRLHMVVQNTSREPLAGDIPSVTPIVGWGDLRHPGEPEASGSNRSVRAFGTWLDDDTYVLVTHDKDDLYWTQALFTRSFLVAFAMAVVLALGGGLYISMSMTRRVRAINQAANAIIDGDLSKRIPVEGQNDALDDVSRSINRMLGRIEELLENIKHVTSSIAHDLRSPLNRHRQRLESARLRTLTAEQYEAVIDAAIEDTDEVLKTFDAMLRIAQIEAGTPRERFTVVDLSERVRLVVDAFEAVAEDMGKHIESEVASGIAVDGDQELLAQMIVNLIENALTHTPSGTRVEVLLQDLPSGPRLIIADNGHGIPAAEREKVFERFYRVDSSRSTPGAGLGLSFVQAVVSLHRGTVKLEDDEPGLRVTIDFGSTAEEPIPTRTQSH
jgi:signal transduction histidine kinase